MVQAHSLLPLPNCAFNADVSLSACHGTVFSKLHASTRALDVLRFLMGREGDVISGATIGATVTSGAAVGRDGRAHNVLDSFCQGSTAVSVVQCPTSTS